MKTEEKAFELAEVLMRETCVTHGTPFPCWPGTIPLSRLLTLFAKSETAELRALVGELADHIKECDRVRVDLFLQIISAEDNAKIGAKSVELLARAEEARKP